MEDLDKILEIAESFMKKAEEYNATGDDTNSNTHAQTFYPAAICRGVRALYEQNKVLIQLLRKRKTE